MSMHVRVFNSTGTTLTGEIADPLQVTFLDELNGAGSGSVQVRAGTPDAALLTIDAVVRVYVDGEARQAWVVEKIDRVEVDGSGDPKITASGRGVLSWLESALVLPQAGLQPLASVDRPFDFAGVDPVATWGTPQGVAWRSDTTARAGSPVGWPDRDAQWIWPTSPTGTVVRGTPAWFKSTFTLATSKLVRFWATADSQFELWLDGTLMLSSSQYSSDFAAWQQFASVTVRVPAGTHRLAVFARAGQPTAYAGLQAVASSDTIESREHGLLQGNQVKVVGVSQTNGLTVGNLYFVRAVTADAFKLATTNSDATIVNVSADSTVDVESYEAGTGGFLLTAATLTDAGAVDTLLRRTDTTNWQSTAVEPYYRPAIILKTLVQEAQGRNVDRLSTFNVASFSSSTDTASQAWTQTTAITLKVGSTLLDAHNELIEQNVDFRVRPTDLRLEAYDALGTDKSTTVRLAPGHVLSRYAGETERPTRTLAVIRTPNGWATSGVSGGRREIYLETSGASSEAVARNLASKLLAQTGTAVETAGTVDIVPAPGATPYVDFAVGDVIGVPSAAGGFERARVLSIAGVLEGNDVKFSIELNVLSGAAGMRRPPREWEESVSARLRAIAPGAELGATITAPQPPESAPSPTPEPAPPTVINLRPPSTPTITQLGSGVRVAWDGKDVDGVDYPTQAYVQVHVSPSSGFTPTLSTIKGIIRGAGTLDVIGLTAGTVYYVKLRGKVDGGTALESTPSTQASTAAGSIVTEIPAGAIGSDLISFSARDLGGIGQFVGSVAPTGGTYYVGDTWVNTNDGTYNTWNGSSWVKREWGTAAISAGAITANQIAANAIIADKIAANALEGKTVSTSNGGSRIVLADGGADTLSFYNANAATASMFAGLNQLFVSSNQLTVLGVVRASSSLSAANIESATVATIPNLRADANGTIVRTSHANSAQRFKMDIVPLDGGDLTGVVEPERLGSGATEDPYAVLDIVPVQFTRTADGVTRTGFIAEDVEAKLATAVDYDETGQIEAVDLRGIVAALLVVVKDQQKRITSLEAGLP